MSLIRLSLAASVALLLAGCGADDSSADSGHDAAPADAAPAAAAPAANASQPATTGQPAPMTGEFQAAPEGAKVAFGSPADGAEVTSPVKVVFTVEGMEVKPAGELVAGTGHHHIVIDGGAIAAGAPVPKDDKNIHFGGGQLEAELELSPGEHTLTMQFADGAHRSFGEQMATTIKVTVAGAAPEAAH